MHSKVLDEITYQFPDLHNLKRDYIVNFTPHYTIDVIIFPWWC